MTWRSRGRQRPRAHDTHRHEHADNAAAEIRQLSSDALTAYKQACLLVGKLRSFFNERRLRKGLA